MTDHVTPSSPSSNEPSPRMADPSSATTDSSTPAIDPSSTETVDLGAEGRIPAKDKERLVEDGYVEAVIDYPGDLPADEPRVVAEEEISAELQREIAMLQASPRFNIGALFMPPIWGPAHGMWLTILFYPLWLLADNCFYAAYAEPSPLSIVIAISVFILLAFGTFLFSAIAQHRSIHRAVSEKNMTVEAYRRSERNWAIVSIIIGVAALIFATWFNLSGIRGGIS